MTETDASAPGRPKISAPGGSNPSGSNTGGATSSESGQDWADQVTNLVVESVDKVRDRTTGPILEYSRILVHLIVALIVLLPVLVMVTLGLIRLLTWAVGQAWISYAIVGSLFTFFGLLLWVLRSEPTF